MLRLAHRILSQPLLMLAKTDQSHGIAANIETALKGAIEKSHIIVADNVETLVSADMQKQWKFEEDFPNLAFPFDYTFIEYNCSFPGFEQVGMLAARATWKNPDFDDLWPKAATRVTNIFAFASRGGRAAIFDGEMQVGTDDKGAFVSAVDITGIWGPPLIPLFLAISFLNCKNVSQSDATKTEGPPEKWLRRQNQPPLRYHHLEIDPMKEVLRREGGSETNGLKKALHICRGHFATYTPEHPLFGRVTGTFWKPAHVRGSAKEGIVVKDYAVNVPSPE